MIEIGSLSVLHLCNREVKAKPRQRRGETERNREKHNSKATSLSRRGRSTVRGVGPGCGPPHSAHEWKARGLSAAGKAWRSALPREEVAAQHTQGHSGQPRPFSLTRDVMGATANGNPRSVSGGDRPLALGLGGCEGGEGPGRSHREVGQRAKGVPSFHSSETNLSEDWCRSVAMLSFRGSMFFISHSSAL